MSVFKLFKKYPVTIKNYEEIIKKMKESSNKYYMMCRQSYTAYTNTDQPIKKTNQKFIHSFHAFNEKDRVIRKFKLNDSPIIITEHHMYTDFKNRTCTGISRSWDSSDKPMIHIATGPDSAIVLNIGDHIRFLPFGGFVIYTTNSWNYYSDTFTIYRHTFIPNRMRGIESIWKIEKEWEEEAEAIEESLYGESGDEDDDF